MQVHFVEVVGEVCAADDSLWRSSLPTFQTLASGGSKRIRG